MENEHFCFPCTCLGEMHVITGFCSVRGPPRGLMQGGQTRWGPCLPVAGEVGCGSLKKCITTSLFEFCDLGCQFARELFYVYM